MRISNCVPVAAALTLLMSTVVSCDIASYEEPIGDTDVTLSEDVPVVLGTVNQEDRLDPGWHMQTQATLFSDGSIAGFTELRNSSSVWGYTGGMVVILVDDQKRPLGYIPVGRWGIDGCAFRCPRRKHVTWNVSLPADEWARVGQGVRGITPYHFEDSKGIPWSEIIHGIALALP